MKHAYALVALLYVCSFSSLHAQVDTASVIRTYYKVHGWEGFHQLINNYPTGNPNSPSAAAEFMQVSSAQWNHTVWDFGKINNVDSVKHVFTFTNTGKFPITIQDVKPTCGCTAGKFTQTPIQPGAKGEVEIKFGPQGKEGTQMKSVSVIMNTEPRVHSLSFQADIVPSLQGK